MTLIETIKSNIREVKDFPKMGIGYKDITPLLKDATLCAEVTKAMVTQIAHLQIDVVAAVESRGFLFGMLLAQALKVPFVPIRKQGKLPYSTLYKAYDLEYGRAVIEIHTDAFIPGQKVLLHDDLLATGGTMQAAAALITEAGAIVEATNFVVELDFLKGRQKLIPYTQNVFSMVHY